MIRLGFIDPNYFIRLPQQQEQTAVFTLAERFAAYEATLPLAEQSPCIPAINALLAQATPAQQLINLKERARTRASEQLKRVDERAADLYTKAKTIIWGLHQSNPEEIEAWGFDIRQTGQRRGHVRSISGRAAYRQFFEQYVAYEESRPAAEQYTFIDLNEMRDVRDGLQDYWRQRDSSMAEAQQQRQLLRLELAPLLLDHLRAALALLVVLRYGCRVVPELELWGYQVQEQQEGAEAVYATDGQPEEELIPVVIGEPTSVIHTDPDTGVSAADLAAPPTE